jgi:hypothetical protein
MGKRKGSAIENTSVSSPLDCVSRPKGEKASKKKSRKEKKAGQPYHILMNIVLSLIAYALISAFC